MIRIIDLDITEGTRIKSKGFDSVIRYIHADSVVVEYLEGPEIGKLGVISADRVADENDYLVID